MDELIDVKIPKGIVLAIREKIKDTDFDSVSEYVTFVLKEVLEIVDEESDSIRIDEEKAKERLEALGYLG